MKTLIKLIVAGIILNALAHAGNSAWHYYQLKDAAQQTIVFGGNATTRQLHDEIMRRAQALEVPLPEENLDVSRDGPRTLARGSYTEDIELFPNYRYPFTFTFEVDSLSVNPTTASDVAPK